MENEITTYIPNLDWVTIIHVCLPVITALIGLFSGYKIKRINTLNEMQNTIDLLVKENNRTIDKIVEVKKLNVDLQLKMEDLRGENEKLKKELEILKKKINKIGDRSNGKGGDI